MDIESNSSISAIRDEIEAARGVLVWGGPGTYWRCKKGPDLARARHYATWVARKEMRDESYACGPYQTPDEARQDGWWVDGWRVIEE